MKLKLLYFASLREKLGVSEEHIQVPESVVCIADVRRWLCARDGVWAEALAPGRNLRAALQQRMVADDALIEDGVELAFFPPVTGG